MITNSYERPGEKGFETFYSFFGGFILFPRSLAFRMLHVEALAMQVNNVSVLDDGARPKLFGKGLEKPKCISVLIRKM